MNAKQRKANQKASDAAEAKVVAAMKADKKENVADKLVAQAEAAKAKIKEAKAKQAGKNKGQAPAPVLVKDKPKVEAKKVTKPAKDAAPATKIGCPCGCGATAEGKGIFLPGHDGRLCGWILALDSGDDKRIEKKVPGDRLALATKAHQAWVKAGRPGGSSHPKVRALFG